MDYSATCQAHLRSQVSSPWKSLTHGLGALQYERRSEAWKKEGRTPVIMQQGGGPRKGKGSDGEVSPESLFLRELRRRGIPTKEDSGEGGGGKASPENASSSLGGATAGDNGRGSEGSSETRSSVKSPPRWANERTSSTPQLDKARALNSEGLEGLPARAWELLRLGGGFPFAFWPLSMSLIAVFIAVYLYFGQDFIHSGQNYRTTTGSPPYVEPFQLLEEELSSNMGPNRVPYRTVRPDSYE